MPPESLAARRARKILTDHSVRGAYLEAGNEDDVIVMCRCGLRFDAGESHAIHQTGQLDDASLFDQEGTS